MQKVRNQKPMHARKFNVILLFIITIEGNSCVLNNRGLLLYLSFSFEASYIHTNYTAKKRIALMGDLLPIEILQLVTINIPRYTASVSVAEMESETLFQKANNYKQYLSILPVNKGTLASDLLYS